MCTVWMHSRANERLCRSNSCTDWLRSLHWFRVRTMRMQRGLLKWSKLRRSIWLNFVEYQCQCGTASTEDIATNKTLEDMLSPGFKSKTNYSSVCLTPMKVSEFRGIWIEAKTLYAIHSTPLALSLWPYKLITVSHIISYCYGDYVWS